MIYLIIQVINLRLSQCQGIIMNNLLLFIFIRDQMLLWVSSKDCWFQRFHWVLYVLSSSLLYSFKRIIVSLNLIFVQIYFDKTLIYGFVFLTRISMFRTLKLKLIDFRSRVTKIVIVRGILDKRFSKTVYPLLSLFCHLLLHVPDHFRTKLWQLWFLYLLCLFAGFLTDFLTGFLSKLFEVKSRLIF